MIHLIEQVRTPPFHDSDDVLFRSTGRTDLLVTSIGIFCFALLCYFKAVPHENGVTVAIGLVALGFPFFIWSRITCEAQFRPRDQVLAVTWTLLGIGMFRYSRDYDDLQIALRFFSGIRSGKYGGSVSTPVAWLSLEAGHAVFIFERALGHIVTEKDIPVLERELGFSEQAPADV